MFNKDEIKKLLPHREPFIFVDEIEEYQRGKKIVAKLFLDPALPFFKGHFPAEPIMPGVLIAEALAQTSGLLIALEKKSEGDKDSENDEKLDAEIFYLASANIKFTAIARPSDTLQLEAKPIKFFAGLAQFSVEAKTKKETVATGTLILAKSENAKK